MAEHGIENYAAQIGTFGPSDDDVVNWFRFHPATPITGPIHDAIRVGFRSLAIDLLKLLPSSPDRTLAMRKLQDAMMSANACVANHQDESVPQLNPHSGTKDV